MREATVFTGTGVGGLEPSVGGHSVFEHAERITIAIATQCMFAMLSRGAPRKQKPTSLDRLHEVAALDERPKSIVHRVDIATNVARELTERGGAFQVARQQSKAFEVPSVRLA